MSKGAKRICRSSGDGEETSFVQGSSGKKIQTQILEGLEYQANSIWTLVSKYGGASQGF